MEWLIFFILCHLYFIFFSESIGLKFVLFYVTNFVFSSYDLQNNIWTLLFDCSHIVLPWRKYWIVIHSEPFRTNSKTFCIVLDENGKKLIWPNPRQQSEWVRTNPKLSFQSDQSELGLIQTELSIRINPNHFDLGFIGIDSDWKFSLEQSELGLIRIKNLVSDSFGLARIDFLPFFIKRDTKRFSDWYGMIHIGSNQISEWIGIVSSIWPGYNKNNIS